MVSYIASQSFAIAPSNSTTGAAGRLSTGSPNNRIGYVATHRSYLGASPALNHEGTQIARRIDVRHADAAERPGRVRSPAASAVATVSGSAP